MVIKVRWPNIVAVMISSFVIVPCMLSLSCSLHTCPYATLTCLCKRCYFCLIKVAQKLLADLHKQFESHWFPFLSGCEFVKAVSGFNCRLCKTFIRCGNDVISHIKGKKHQKNYQVYQTLN